MYVWQFSLNGYVWLGRSYKEFYNMINDLHDALELGYCKNLVVYVHNLSYEFNCLRKYMEVSDYFAIDKRTPLYVIDKRGIEFRCSYHLSGYSLEYLGNIDNNMLHKYKVSKLVGNLNYYKVRTPETPLTRKEVRYCINDVRIVTNYIQELLERGEDIAHIPLTKTGRVRIALNHNCILSPTGKGMNMKYVKKMQECVIESVDDYRTLRRGFAGGFTHPNPFNTNITITDGVIPFDINSDYPFQLVINKYPTGPANHAATLTMGDYNYLLGLGFHIVADFQFTDLEPIFFNDYYISSSKCWELADHKECNGRVTRAALLGTTITELDFDIIKQAYKWSSLKITGALVYASDYLPIEFVETVLDFYEAKTTLKGIPEKVVEYMNGKEQLNSCYGMCATDMVRDIFTYDEDFIFEPADVESAIMSYNKSKKRTTYYPWALYCTAYARHKLWTEGILPLGPEYIYSDTDSIYAFDSEATRAHFKKINEKTIERLEALSEERRIALRRLKPVNIKGEEQPLGIWSEEKRCIKFKTLGAKRYMKTTEDGKTSSTIAGLSKEAIDYIMEHGGYDFFTNEMEIPATDSGRLTHTYLDEGRSGTVTDYRGNKYNYSIRCGVHMEPAPFTLSMSKLFIDFLRRELS